MIIVAPLNAQCHHAVPMPLPTATVIVILAKVPRMLKITLGEMYFNNQCVIDLSDSTSTRIMPNAE